MFTLILHRKLHQKAKSFVTEHANRMHVKPAAHAAVVGSNAVTKQQYTHYEQ